MRQQLPLMALILVAACASATSSSDPDGRAGLVLRPTNAEPYCAWVPNTDTVVYSPLMVDPPPMHREAVFLIPPGSIARDRRNEHRAVLMFTVRATGAVDSASIQVVSSTDDESTATAIKSVLASKYWPGCRAGQPVAVKDVQQTYRFGGRGPRQ